MAEFFKDHWELVAAFNVSLLTIIGILVTALVRGHDKACLTRTKALDKRVDVLEEEQEKMGQDIQKLNRENAASIQDREALHEEIKSIKEDLIRHIDVKVDSLDEKNASEHGIIMSLIKKNGGSHG